jgi:UPF0755 protein
LLVTLFLLLLAVPLMLLKFFAYLLRSMGAPMKSIKHLFGFIILVGIIAVAFIVYGLYMPYDIGMERRSVMVNDNDSFISVMSKLQKADILRGGYLFKVAAITYGVDKSLSPGRYDFSGKISQIDILKKLKRRDIATIMVTIPEGWTAYKTADLMRRELEIDSASFIAHVFDTSFSRKKYNRDNLEGYLFPETYRLWYGIKADEIIDILIGEFDRQTTPLFAYLSPESRSAETLVILASIIQAEAYLGEEMSLISSVYHNRLRKKMRLQADPTVIYGIGGLERPLNRHDLDYDSPYNTYKYKGLPPGPINSPGLEAIKAAMYPEKSEYIYFVAEGGGKHIFSRTLAEHNRAIRKIKRVKRNK